MISVLLVIRQSRAMHESGWSLKIWWWVMITHMSHLDSARTSFCISIGHVRWHIDVFRKIAEEHSHGLEAFSTQIWMLIPTFGFKYFEYLHGKGLGENKHQRGWTEETLGYKTVSERLCANSYSKSDERSTQSLKTQIRSVWLARKQTNQVKFKFFLTFFSVVRLLSEKNSSIQTTSGWWTVFKLRSGASSMILRCLPYWSW